jgi:2-dehydro-3-deoxygluconokinase
MSEAIEVISFGEPMIGIYPPEASSITDDVPLTKTWGGDTSNFALAVAKLGHSSAYLTRIGEEEFGRSFLSLWEKNGVDTSLVQTDPEHATGLYFISYEGVKHNFLYYRRNSAACFINPDNLDWEVVRQARVIHLSGISQAIHPNALDFSFKLLDFAKKHNITVSYDINFRPPLWNMHLARSIISYTIEQFADILFMTDDELALLGWENNIQAFLDTCKRQPEIVALKRGEAGSVIKRGERTVEIPPFSITVVDTVGAGDAFDAGLITGYLEGADTESLGRFANGVAAFTCRGKGPLDCQPLRGEIDQFLT